MNRYAGGALALLMAALAPGLAFAAKGSSDGLWKGLEETRVQRGSQPRQIVPQRYQVQRLDRDRLDSLLARVPLEGGAGVDSSGEILSLPRPDGRYERFRVVESPIMAPELAAKYPQIRTWLGQGIDDPTATLRFDTSPQGLRAQVIGWRSSYYIDPYQPGDLEHYVVYAKHEAPDTGERPRCGVTGETLRPQLPNFQKQGAIPKISSGTQLRSYRLAVAATGEYTAFHGGTKANALAAIVTTMNRVNGIYERELAVRMILVGNTDAVIYTNGATDPYTNEDGGAMLSENIATLGSVIGNANFDIGHVVSTGGGGVAFLGSVCGSSKAGGVTGSFSPVGDPFDVDYVAHEIGHQFGGDHTFNSSSGACSGNRASSAAYEPGSGVTIQAYAGICSADNLQSNSLDYFHRISLNQMLSFVANPSGGGSCDSATATGNTPPSVSTPSAFTIPARTPFELSASGSDANGDSLTYLWEQFDLGAANAPGSISDTGSGPLFRSFRPSTSPNRVFPSWRWILGNGNTAPTTAPLEGSSSPGFLTAEVLPSTSRVMNFRVTARDNRAGGGGTNEASTAVTVVGGAGPFRVTSPNTRIDWPVGSARTVSWDVAGTSGNGINTANVRITVSLDGGETWPLELAASTPNDGSESVALPANTPTGTRARLRVQAVGNIFFDVSDSDFNIVAGGPAQPLLQVAATQLTSGNGLIEPNECNQFTVSLRNIGGLAATGVSATLSTSTPNISITQASSSFADIAANGGTQSAQTPFLISSGAELVCFGTVDLQLSVSYSGGGSPYTTQLQLPVGQPGAENYSFSASSGASLAGGGTLVAGSQVDDAVVSLSVPSGFDFSVYDQNFAGGETLRVSTNGNLQLTATGGSGAYSNGALPSAGNADTGLGAFPAAGAVLMPYWDDLDLRTSGFAGAGIYQQLTGTEPNRRWLIEWRGQHVDDTGTAQTVNFAIEFVEGSGDFNYLYALTGNTNANGSSATVGVQSASTGSRLTQYSLNTATLSPGLRLAASRAPTACSAGSGLCSAEPAVQITQSGGSTAVTEGGAGDSYSVVLGTPPSGTVSFTASPDAQLQVTPTSLQFDTLNWNLPQTITVTATNDSVVEGTHSGLITHAVSGGGYGSVSVPPITVNITDNDSATLSTAAVVVAEGDSGNTPMNFTLQLSGQVAGGFSVTFATRAGTASAGTDFVSRSGSVAFDGSLNPSRTVSVQIVGDTAAEADETLFLDLSTSAAGVLLAPASAQGEIVNDDFFADLGLRMARLPGVVSPGQPISYVIDVVNGSNVLTVPQANANFVPAPQLQGLSWTCTAGPGSSCSASSGSGGLPTLTLAAGGSARVQVNATLAAGTPLNTRLSSSASVSLAAPYSDPETGNNSASVRSRVGVDGVFEDGFESP